MIALRTLASALALAAAAAAQAPTCGPDVVVDDFAKTQSAVIGGESRPVNLLGGDYGAQGVTWSIDTAKRAVVLTAGTANIGVPEPQANPGTAPTVNYWFAKFDAGACFDLTKFTAIEFDLVGPAGSDMNFTLTQKAANCADRLVDSAYNPLSKYLRMDGTKKHVSLPLKDFATNLVGGKYDMLHLKDWTAVNIVPAGAVFELSNLVLKGCAGAAPSASASTTAPKTSGGAAPSASPAAPSAAGPSPTQAQKAGAERSAAAGIIGTVAAAVAALLV
ncbi:hypothetical protein HK105_206344 [Polyrhizophydium stewartii]|uniref:Uncharacterized protein n=1 Tax=Polyrhizophydium stewartii TaxID=2732419 RepID=A0ABR4N3M1_9FUNG